MSGKRMLETKVLETNARKRMSRKILPPENPSAKNIEFKNKALTAYREFLTTKDWHSLTATDRYPRGDSRSSYAFSIVMGSDAGALH